MKIQKYTVPTLSLLALMAATDAQANTEDEIKINGFVRAVSAYVSKGSTNNPDNEDATLQAFISANYKGFYAAWWTSKLDTSAKYIQTGQPASASEFYEHLFLTGYKSKYKDLRYDWNLTTYYYPGGKNSTALSTRLRLSQPINKKTGSSAGIFVETSLNDVFYMNKGDTYVELLYTQPLPQKFTLDLSAGANFYTEDGKTKYRPIDGTPNNFVFRHASLQLSHPIVNDNTNVWIKYIIGGKNRGGIDQKNMAVIGVQYNF